MIFVTVIYRYVPISNVLYTIYSNSSTFLSAALLVAVSMYRLALPHVNVLTKVDQGLPTIQYRFLHGLH